MCKSNVVADNVPGEQIKKEPHVEDSAKDGIAVALTSTEKLIEGLTIDSESKTIPACLSSLPGELLALILHFVLASENIYTHRLTSKFSSSDPKTNGIWSPVPQTAFYNLSLVNRSFYKTLNTVAPLSFGVHNGLGEQIAPARVRCLRTTNDEDENKEVEGIVFMSREMLNQELGPGSRVWANFEGVERVESLAVYWTKTKEWESEDVDNLCLRLCKMEKLKRLFVVHKSLVVFMSGGEKAGNGAEDWKWCRGSNLERSNSTIYSTNQGRWPQIGGSEEDRQAVAILESRLQAFWQFEEVGRKFPVVECLSMELKSQASKMVTRWWYRRLATGYEYEILQRHIMKDGWRRKPITWDR